MVILDGMEGWARHPRCPEVLVTIPAYPVFPLRLDVQICRTGTESDTRPCHTTKTSSCARAVAGKALSLPSLTFRPFRTRFYKGILKFVAVSGKWFHVTPSRSSVLYTVLSLILNDFLLRQLPTQTRKCGNMMRICCGIQTSFPTLFTSPTSTDWSKVQIQVLLSS